MIEKSSTPTIVKSTLPEENCEEPREGDHSEEPQDFQLLVKGREVLIHQLLKHIYSQRSHTITAFLLTHSFQSNLSLLIVTTAWLTGNMSLWFWLILQSVGQNSNIFTIIKINLFDNLSQFINRQSLISVKGTNDGDKERLANWKLRTWSYHTNDRLLF